MTESKRTLFKMELFEDFTVDTFVVIPDSNRSMLGIERGEILKIKTISSISELLMQFFRISLFPGARMELMEYLNTLPEFEEGGK